MTPTEKVRRIRARSAIAIGIASGDIVRPTNCSNCRRPCKPHAHHHDYSKPLDVEWLCPKCHRRMNTNPVEMEHVSFVTNEPDAMALKGFAARQCVAVSVIVRRAIVAYINAEA